MIPMYPWQKRKLQSGIALAQAANPTGYSLPYDPMNPVVTVPPPPPPEEQPGTDALLDQYGYREPMPWRDPVPPYETQKTPYVLAPPPAIAPPPPASPASTRPPSTIAERLGIAGTKPLQTPEYLQGVSERLGTSQPRETHISTPDAIKGLAPEPTAEEAEEEESWVPEWLRNLIGPDIEKAPAAGKEIGAALGDAAGALFPQAEEEAQTVAAEGAADSGRYRLPRSGVRVPTYKPGESEMPEWADDVPEAVTYKGPDYTKSNEYYAAAKPKPYEEDPMDIGLAGLAGLASGFSPEGTVGEILGRMAGPGFQGLYRGREVEEEQQKEAEYALAQWNASMGQAAAGQAETEAEVTNQNAEAIYQNALDKMNNLKDAMNYARDEDRFMLEQEYRQAELELSIAQENRQAAYQEWQMEQPDYTELDRQEDNLYQGFTRGHIPGLDFDVQGFKQTISDELRAKAMGDAENPGDPVLQQKMMDQTAWEKYVDDVAWSQFRAQYGG